MANKQIVFSDRLVSLSVHNGLVRLDFAVNMGPAKTKDGKDAQRMEVTTQLVMPLDAFAQAVGTQQQLLGKLAERAKGKAPQASPDTTPKA